MSEMEKAKMAMAMMNPATQLKMARIFGWVDGFVEAVQKTGIKLSEMKESNNNKDPREVIADVVMTLISKSKVKHVEEKNALVLELGKEKKVKLTLRFKEVE